MEVALAILIQNQATFVRDMREMERANFERFTRIENTMAAILRQLVEHRRILERLPEAERDKIGFKSPA